MTIVDDSVWLKVNEKEIGWKVLRGEMGGWGGTRRTREVNRPIGIKYMRCKILITLRMYGGLKDTEILKMKTNLR